MKPASQAGSIVQVYIETVYGRVLKASYGQKQTLSTEQHREATDALDARQRSHPSGTTCGVHPGPSQLVYV